MNKHNLQQNLDTFSFTVSGDHVWIEDYNIVRQIECVLNIDYSVNYTNEIKIIKEKYRSLCEIMMIKRWILSITKQDIEDGINQINQDKTWFKQPIIIKNIKFFPASIQILWKDYSK